MTNSPSTPPRTHPNLPLPTSWPFSAHVPPSVSSTGTTVVSRTTNGDATPRTPSTAPTSNPNSSSIEDRRAVERLTQQCSPVTPTPNRRRAGTAVPATTNGTPTFRFGSGPVIDLTTPSPAQTQVDRTNANGVIGSNLLDRMSRTFAKTGPVRPRGGSVRPSTVRDGSVQPSTPSQATSVQPFVPRAGSVQTFIARAGSIFANAKPEPAEIDLSRAPSGEAGGGDEISIVSVVKAETVQASLSAMMPPPPPSTPATPIAARRQREPSSAPRARPRLPVSMRTPTPVPSTMQLNRIMRSQSVQPYTRPTYLSTPRFAGLRDSLRPQQPQQVAMREQQIAVVEIEEGEIVEDDIVMVDAPTATSRGNTATPAAAPTLANPRPGNNGIQQQVQEVEVSDDSSDEDDDIVITTSPVTVVTRRNRRDDQMLPPIVPSPQQLNTTLTTVNVNFVLTAGVSNQSQSYSFQAKVFPTTEMMQICMQKVKRIVAKELKEAPKQREIHPAMWGMMGQGGAGDGGGERRAGRGGRGSHI